ncbi:MAG TPA: hypothetical protein VKI00_25665 [Mycobacterium sp.]|uniref:hypothetical protein n=1 Tax=Mycobacterium sp. TaxID=1785 RepID=UPI002CCE2906|nr:hypothetical protein [Mycobacterium sp.]HME78917.1 hypothetical protein [Mycobacterium sp.]
MSERVIAQRSDILEWARVACAVMDNEARPESVRLGAQQVFADCSHDLLYTDGPEKRYHLHPLAFHVKGFYRRMVDDLLESLPDEAKAANPALVTLAGCAAELIDNQRFSTDYRTEAVDALRDVLRALEPACLRVVEDCNGK